MTATIDQPPIDLPIQFSDSQLESFRREDAEAARFIGVVLSVMFFYSLVIMAYVYWLTKQAAA